MPRDKLRNSKRLVVAGGAVLIVMAIGFLLLFATTGKSGEAEMKHDKKQGLLIVSNKHYEMAFDSGNGGVAYMKERGAAKPISLGNPTLWRAVLSDDSSVQSAEADSFAYEWNKSGSKLLLKYGGPLAVEISIAFASDARMVMNASLQNDTGHTVKSFRFPFEWKVGKDDVLDAMLPMLPGARLKPEFFRESNSFYDQYPGVMFASYLALRTTGGNLAMYDLAQETTPLTEIGYKGQIADAAATSLVHNYKTWVQADGEWHSPGIVVEVGGDYATSIAGYRELNGIHEYASLADKLGEDAERYYGLPLYKTDISAIKDADWNRLGSDYVDRMNYNGLIHLVAFQSGGHDQNYPDFMPPDPKWGGQAQMAAFVKKAQEKGNIVVPYTNMSWWGVGAPTLSKLPPGVELRDIVVERENGSLMQEDYGPHSGYVVNTVHPYFRERVAAEHRKLLDEAGFDGIFEDQWGIRNSPYVFNANPGNVGSQDGASQGGNATAEEDSAYTEGAGNGEVAFAEGLDPSTAYFAGVRQYFSSLNHRMYMEDGTDLLANDSIGFMGSTYLWDLLGYRKNTAAYTEYYPLAGMLLRDKVMFYHHNLAGETMTDDSDMLRWNMAMGYNLSADFYNGVTSPWVDAIGVLQKHVLAGYGDRLVVGFNEPAPGVTETDFGSHVVTANGNKDGTYVLCDEEESLAGDAPASNSPAKDSFAKELRVNGPPTKEVTLAPGGFHVEAKDGSVAAGNYVSYNGLNLDPGEHILAEVRSDIAIRVYQPIGTDTTLRIVKGEDWRFARATAFAADGKKLAELAVRDEEGYAWFDYVAQIRGDKVGYVELTPAESPDETAETFPKVKAEVNLAVAMPVYATSMTDAAFDPKNTVDGDPFTYWESTARQFPQLLTVDLGAEKLIAKVRLRLPPQDAWEERSQEIEVFGSKDGKIFESVLPAASYTYSPETGNQVELRLERPADTRYIRVTITSNSSWPAAQVSEFEVYEQDAGI